MTALPRRIQRRRTAGWRMPDSAAYVGRPTRFGNPFRVGAEITEFPFRDAYGPIVRDAAHAVEIFEGYARITTFYDAMVRTQLAGRDLACWCRLDQPCHADVLLEIANQPIDRTYTCTHCARTETLDTTGGADDAARARGWRTGTTTGGTTTAYCPVCTGSDVHYWARRTAAMARQAGLTAGVPA